MGCRRAVSLFPGRCSRGVEQPYSLWYWMSLTQALGIGSSCGETAVHSNCHPLGHTELNWAVKQLAEASGVLWSLPKSFFTFVDSVAMDSLRFFCVCGIDPTAWRTQHDTVASHLQYHTLLREKLIMKAVGECSFILDYFFSSQEQRWLPSVLPFIRTNLSTVLGTKLQMSCISDPKWLSIHDFCFFECVFPVI